MKLLRIGGIVVGLMTLVACTSAQQTSSLKFDGPCAPNFVSLGLQF